MTITVKLDPALEARLRRHAAASGQSTSDVVRAALHALLAQAPAEPVSAYELGAGLFGRHAGPPDLAATRRSEWAEVVAERHARRSR